MPQKKWGDWTLNHSMNTLTYARCYELDLDRFITSAALLDMIFQVAGKGWATPEVCRDLLTALEETVDPQANLCSWGVEKGRKGKRAA